MELKPSRPLSLSEILEEKIYGKFKLVEPLCEEGYPAYDSYKGSVIEVVEMVEEDGIMGVIWVKTPTLNSKHLEEGDIVKLTGMVIGSKWEGLVNE